MENTVSLYDIDLLKFLPNVPSTTRISIGDIWLLQKVGSFVSDTFGQLKRIPDKIITFLMQKTFISNVVVSCSWVNVPWTNLLRTMFLEGIQNSDASSETAYAKIERYHDKFKTPLLRCNLWIDLARLERLLGNDLVAVTYELRILRLLGEDRVGLLPTVVETLNKHGFVEEAKAALAQYANPVAAPARVYAFLHAAYQRNLVRQDKPFEIIDDRRSAVPPKVSVIVSLYKAADKLELFWHALQQQTLVKKGLVEIVLVDSGSPTDERVVFNRLVDAEPVSVVFARSAQRETIQAAWNRGIGLAKAPYLVFLGVDETLYPEALEVLADELDKAPDIDWVMANSLLTEVNEHGALERDIMTYDRTGGTKDHVYLETCYLSWVGGMYRASIHERFGYYDETFGAAGDTEFKNRIMPHIKVKFIPKMLGLFLNYPDGQTTASPKAEIEDSRAWYLHRTPGGVQYAFENRPTEEAERLAQIALGYRKSYCGHYSSDIEYATYLTDYVAKRKPSSVMSGEVHTQLKDLLARLKRLEFSAKLPLRFGPLLRFAWTTRVASQTEKKHRAIIGNVANPVYKIHNDNRYEQHSWLWKSK